MKIPTALKNSVHIFGLSFLFICTACSLDYGTASQAQVQSPEFIFYDVRFTRIENNTVKLETDAAKLEQYSGIDAMYGEKVRFALYDNNGKISVEGSCALLSADRENELYHFFSGIEMYSREHHARVSADNLRWDAKKEILDSGKKDSVRIIMETENGTRFETNGTGFIARKKDRSYSFSEAVEGKLSETEKEEPLPVEDEEKTEHTEDGETDE